MKSWVHVLLLGLFAPSAHAELPSVWDLRGAIEAETPEASWSLAAGEAGFPMAGLGPAGELWLLEPPSVSAPRSAWADLLHAVEAAYRQSPLRGESPPAEMTIGEFGECVVRSAPVDSGTPLDLWLPFELEGGDEPVGVRRFLWWVDPGPSRSSCAAAGQPATLRLFPTDGEGVLLTVEAVPWRTLRYSEADPDDWSPRVRWLLTQPAVTDTAIELTEPQRDLRRTGRLDLCQVEGLGDLCRRNERVRRQLYTAIPSADADPPWTPERLRASQQACQKVLEARAVIPDACTVASLWHNAVAGELVAGFRGDVVVSREPRVLETWRDGTVEWRLDAAEAPVLTLDLLDGTRARVSVAAPRGSSSWWIFGLTALAMAAAFFVLPLRLRRERQAAMPAWETHKELERLLAQSVSDEAPWFRELRRQLTERVGEELARSLPEQARAALEPHLDAAVQRLEARAAELGGELEGPTGNGAGELETPSTRDAEPARLASVKSFRAEVETLGGADRRQLIEALEAISRLGYWIELLWPVLQEASGSRLDTVPSYLPEPASEEWRSAQRTLSRFVDSDAAAARRLLHMLASNNGDAPPSVADASFLERSGLLEAGRDLPERLKRYLEPFDHLGRLGEVTLALQYLVEAYPVEQLSGDQRSRLRNELTDAVRSVRLEDDFHRLVAAAASGIGLSYRPVSYYKSRIDESEYAFVRQQVSPISLTDRVGFAATTDPTVIVRLERPFFFQANSNVYYAGHAHVARG